MEKLVISQINTIAGDIKINAEKIIAEIKKAQSENADYIVFPELSLCGSPLGDIAKRHKNIYRLQQSYLNNIIGESKNITVIIGLLDENKESSIAIIKNGKIIATTKTYYIFENTAIILGQNNLKELPKNSYKSVILLENIPSRTNCEYKRNKVFSDFAKDFKTNLVYVNKVGYGHNYCYDGASRIYNSLGEVTLRAKSFEEDFSVAADFKGKVESLPIGSDKEQQANFDLNYENDLDRTYKSIIFGIREYFHKNGFSKAVLGLSGGLDSTISATLLADALGKENVVGISMPSKITSSESKNDAKTLAQNLGITFLEVPLADEINNMKNMFSGIFEEINMPKYAEPTTIENLQARTRATILWSVSNEVKGMLPVATSDKSEAYIGYATVNGDMSGGFAPIADVTKTKLFALGAFLNRTREQKNAIPQAVLEKPPGPELKINPKTGKTISAEEANMPYEFLDEIVWEIEKNGLSIEDLIKHKFYYEKNHTLTIEQKEEWIRKFFWKMHCAVYKWHISAPIVITDANSICQLEYSNPILSKI